VIAHLQRASHTAGLLTYLYGPGERGNHTNPRLIAGDGHGAPIEMLAQPDVLTYLAHALDAPVERLGARAPELPVWVCSVRSDPRHPDLIDSQWADVARRVVAATGIAPAGDPDACRWIAVRNQARLVHVVATLAREDGNLHNAYRDAFHLQTECHRI
ncbi:mobilization protein, partial [Streptomyces sp. ADMS]|nr:mobilization protein [Streptomyces sp. ADMS]